MGVWLAVAAGGALGSIARHGVNHLQRTYLLSTQFPVATMTVNLIGCFVIGFLSGINPQRMAFFRFHWREFLIVGVLGGFTTFSTFGLDTYTLARAHASTLAGVNVGIQVAGGLAAVWLGHAVAVATGLARA
jgi:CrcB protein